jgi:hypothetical protein
MAKMRFSAGMPCSSARIFEARWSLIVILGEMVFGYEIFISIVLLMSRRCVLHEIYITEVNS